MELATSNPVEQDNFPTILQRTLAYEGGGQLDPTGPSKFGILEKNYQAWLKKNGRDYKSIDKLTLPEATDIYSSDYYKANSLHLLPMRTSGVIFDWVVNSGQRNSIPTIQKIVGATPDGRIGPQTVKAINAYIATHGEDALLENIITQRRSYIDRITKSNPKLPAQGLRNRIDRLEHDYLRVNHGIRSLKQ